MIFWSKISQSLILLQSFEVWRLKLHDFVELPISHHIVLHVLVDVMIDFLFSLLFRLIYSIPFPPPCLLSFIL